MKSTRLIAGTMALILAGIGCGVSANAADTISISGSKEEAAAGEEFAIDVSLAGVPSTGINALEFAIKYDSSVVTVTGVEEGSIAKTGSDEQEKDVSASAPSFDTNIEDAGVIDVLWTTGTESNYWIKKDGTFLTIKGTVNSNAKAGDKSEFEVVAIDRPLYQDSTDKNTDIVLSAVTEGSSTDYSAKLTSGELTVGSSTSETTTSSVEDTTAADTTTAAESTTSSGESKVFLGDVDGNGSCTIADAVYLNRALAGSVELNDLQKKNADVYRESANLTETVVDAKDSEVLLKYLVSSITSLPYIEQ